MCACLSEEKSKKEKGSSKLKLTAPACASSRLIFSLYALPIWPLLFPLLFCGYSSPPFSCPILCLLLSGKIISKISNNLHFRHTLVCVCTQCSVHSAPVKLHCPRIICHDRRRWWWSSPLLLLGLVTDSYVSLFSSPFPLLFALVMCFVWLCGFGWWCPFAVVVICCQFWLLLPLPLLSDSVRCWWVPVLLLLLLIGGRWLCTAKTLAILSFWWRWYFPHRYCSLHHHHQVVNRLQLQQCWWWFRCCPFQPKCSFTEA